MHTSSPHVITLFLGFFLFINKQASAQSEWQNRNAVSINASLSEKLQAEYSHMRAYNMTDRFKNTFNQHAFQIGYRLNKRLNFSGGIQLINPVGPRETRTRIYLRAAHSTRLDQFTWTNSVRVETNSKNETRFRQRIGIATRLGLRKRMDFLNLSPSITYSMFYNIGGNPIRYYDEEASLLARQTPDGFHRGRLTLAFNSKLNDYVAVTLYYMRQQEFNFLTPSTRKMNVYDPVRNRTLRPFNNFNVLGLSLNISLDELINL